MNNNWILEVLADLATFARQNGMAALAEKLDDTQNLAALELALQTRQEPGRNYDA